MISKNPAPGHTTIKPPTWDQLRGTVQQARATVEQVRGGLEQTRGLSPEQLRQSASLLQARVKEGLGISERHLPQGPGGHFLLGSLPEFATDPLGALERCSVAFGDVSFLRAGVWGTWLFAHPDAIEEVLMTKQSAFVKDKITTRLKYSLGDGLLTSGGEHWKRQRRLIAPSMKKGRMAHYADTMVACTREAMDTWRDGERDVHRDMMAMALEIAARTMFGASVDPEQGRVVGEVIEEVMGEFIRDARSWRRILPEWVPTQGRLRSQRAIQRVDHLMFGMIQQARADRSDSENLLRVLLDAKDEDGSEMSDLQVRDEAVTMFVAGHETTALALSYAMHCLAHEPDAQARLHRELDEVLGDRLPTAQDVPRLVWTQAIVQEVLRLYPPAWTIGREAAEPVEIAGWRLEKGDQVLTPQWLVHHDPRWFSDPRAFRPERWLDGLKDRLPRFAYFPFGGGARTCVGNHFALLEAQLALATIFQRVGVSRAPGFELEVTPSITLRPVHGVRLRVERR